MAEGLPDGYHLERDADLLVLRGRGERFVAAFSALGATEEAVWGAAWDDRRRLAAPGPPAGAKQPPRPVNSV
jgi:hypothetical protein